MLTEEIFLQSVRIILLIATLTKLYLIWKYLTKKPLGMQTILDQVIKDFIKIFIMTIIPTFFATMKFEEPYAKPTAIFIVMIFYFTRLIFVWQFFIAAVIRYVLENV